MDFRNSVHWLFFGTDDAVTAGNDTGWSSWVDCAELKGCQFFMGGTSAGSPVLTLTVQVSPINIESSDTTYAPATYYEELTVTSSGGKTYAYYEPPDGTNSYSVLDRPFGQMRCKIAVATADCSALVLGLCKNGLG